MSFSQTTASNTLPFGKGLFYLSQALLLCLFFIPTVSSATANPAITIQGVIDYQQNKQLLIDSESTFNLPDNALEAIEHNIPLSFYIQIELLEQSNILGIKRSRVRKRVQFHNEVRSSGIHRHYFIYNSRNHKSQSFKTLDEALKTLSTIRAFPIASLSELHPEQRYTLRMRIELDYWKLPTPLLLEAIFTNKWLLDSQWYETTLKTPLSWQ